MNQNEKVKNISRSEMEGRNIFDQAQLALREQQRPVGVLNTDQVKLKVVVLNRFLRPGISSLGTA